MGHRSVLVVDDEMPMADMIAEVLAAEGHLVETAYSGPSALAKIRSRPFDLVLSDIRMPGMDGPALYREAQRLDGGWGRRFVFLTGDAFGTDTAEFLARSGRPCLAKPFDFEELKLMAEGILGR